MSTGAERILAAFSGLSADARIVVGESLEIQPVPLLKSVGSGLCYGPKLANMVIARGLKSARWDGSAILLERLSDDQPWGTIKDCLAEALEGAPVAQLRGGNDS